MIDFAEVFQAAQTGFVLGSFIPVVAFLAEQTQDFQDRVTFTENATRLEKLEAWVEWIVDEAKAIGAWDFLYVVAFSAVLAAALTALSIGVLELIGVIGG